MTKPVFEHNLKSSNLIAENLQYPISDVVDDISSASQLTHFYFFCGPSWSGKTQLVYALDLYSKHPMNGVSMLPSLAPKFECVLHFVLCRYNKRLQPIYKAHTGLSEVFMTAINLDFNRITDVLMMEASKPFWSMEFIELMNIFRITSATVENDSKEWAGRVNFLGQRLKVNIICLLFSSMPILKFAPGNCWVF